MLRGQQKLFTDLLQHEPPMVAVKGRSATLIDARNELLLHRYYWHNRRDIEPGVRMSYQSLLDTIKNEMFLEARTIVNIMDEYYRNFQQIRQQYKDYTDKQLSREMQARWPWLVW